VLEVFRRIGFVPRACGWEITLRCNMGCRHCGSLAGELATTSYRTTNVCAWRRAGAAALRACDPDGGEPTLRQDWDVFGERLARQKVRVAILSKRVDVEPTRR